MQNENLDVIGGARLVKKLRLNLAFCLPIVSAIAGRRTSEQQIETGFRTEYYTEAQRPENTLIAHLLFHLKNEIVSFEFLAQCFVKVEKDLIQQWINHEPTGQYARRVAFGKLVYPWRKPCQLSI